MLCGMTMAHRVEELPVFSHAQQFSVAVAEILARSRETRSNGGGARQDAGRIHQVPAPVRLQGSRSLPRVTTPPRLRIRIPDEGLGSRIHDERFRIRD